MNFWQTVAASGVGFVIANIVSAFFAGIVFRASSVNSQRDFDVDQIATISFEIRDIAKQYWTIDGGDPASAELGASLIGRLNYLGLVVANLFQDSRESLSAANLDLNRFHESVSGGAFGEKGRTADKNRLTRIEADCYALVYKVEKLKRKLRPPFLARD